MANLNDQGKKLTTEEAKRLGGYIIFGLIYFGFFFVTHLEEERWGPVIIIFGLIVAIVELSRRLSLKNDEVQELRYRLGEPPNPESFAKFASAENRWWHTGPGEDLQIGGVSLILIMAILLAMLWIVGVFD